MSMQISGNQNSKAIKLLRSRSACGGVCYTPRLVMVQGCSQPGSLIHMGAAENQGLAVDLLPSGGFVLQIMVQK